MNKIIISFLSVILLTSCIKLGNRDKVSQDYPSDIRDMCIAERNNAFTCMQSKGFNTPNGNVPVKVVKIKGTKQIGGWWCWQSPEWNGLWVGGLTRSQAGYIQVEIGCNPNTMGDVNSIALKHEFGHYWCITTGEYTHIPIYKSCFYNWNDPVKIKTFTFTNNTEQIVVDFIEE